MGILFNSFFWFLVISTYQSLEFENSKKLNLCLKVTEKEGGHKWYQSIGHYFASIPADF
jgi:hypothetical protein